MCKINVLIICYFLRDMIFWYKNKLLYCVDMTFTHEGNKTCIDGLVNFEKMHMLAQTMRTIRYCRSRHLGKFC